MTTLLFINPQFSLTVATKIGKEFLKLNNQHFDKTDLYYKILNQNTIKYHIVVAWKILKQKYLSTIAKS